MTMPAIFTILLPTSLNDRFSALKSAHKERKHRRQSFRTSRRLARKLAATYQPHRPPEPRHYKMMKVGIDDLVADDSSGPEDKEEEEDMEDEEIEPRNWI